MDLLNVSGSEPQGDRLAEISEASPWWPLPLPLPSMPAMLPAALATLRRRGGAATPDGFAASYRLPAPTAAQLAVYARVVGAAADGAAIPLGYFYLLAQRAQLALMLDRRYRYAVPGMIHVGNAMALHEAPQADRPLRIVAAVEVAQPEPGRETARFDVVFEQNGIRVASCVSDYLARRPRGPARGRGAASEPLPLPLAAAREDWRLGAMAGWRYARVSGDYNPIHLSALLARLFGFRQAIAQGMYCAGRAAAAIEADAGRPLSALTVRFRRPVALPAQLTLRWLDRDGRGHFALESADAGTLHLDGRYELC